MASTAVACDDPVDPPVPEASAVLEVVPLDVVGVVGSAPDPQPAVRVLTPEGDSLPGVDVLWWHGVPPERVTHITTTDSRGVARADWTLGPVAGPQVITARLANGVEVSIEAVAEPGPVAVIDAPTRVLAEVGASAPASLRLEDSFGNEVPSSRGTWSVASSDLASVDGSGVVSGLGTGATELRVEVDDTATALPLEIRPLLRLVKIAAGLENHGCGLTAAGEAYCWGRNGNGQLGNGNRDPVDGAARVVSPEAFLLVSAGDRKACALGVSGLGYCWGLMSHSLLGDGTTTGFALVPEPIALDLPLRVLEASHHHTQCAVTMDGNAYCWGHNDFGQVGQGFVSATILTPQPLPVDGAVADLALSAFHGCALTESGKAWCWGQGADVGRGPDNPSVQAPAPVSGEEVFVDLVHGGSGTCGLAANGRAYCWGGERYMTALEPEEDFRVPTLLGDFRFEQLALGWFDACGVLDTGPVCWSVTPPEPAPLADATEFAVGFDFTCALDSEGAPWCWGDEFAPTPIRIYERLPPE